MKKEKTLVIIKPDAVMQNVIGTIVGQFETRGLCVVGCRMLRLDRTAAERFYAVHQGKEFYAPLIDFMTSGPVVALALSGEGAIARAREIIGKTDYREAAVDTIRRRFGTSVRHNAVHGSDSAENAAREIAFFFSPQELFGRS